MTKPFEFRERTEPSTVHSTAREAEDALFGVDQTVTEKSRLYKATAALGSATVAVVALKTGIGVDTFNDIFDAKVVPSLPVFPRIVDGLVGVNEGLRAVAPVVATAGVGVHLRNKRRARSSAHEAQLESLARSDYSGVDGIDEEQDESMRSKRTSVSRVRMLMGGLGVATLTSLLTGGSSGLEHEVSNGPLRPVGRTFEVLAPQGAGSQFILTQSPEISFMDDSYIDAETIDRLTEAADQHNVTIVPFNKALPNIDGRPGLAISIPDEIFEQLTDVKADGDCGTIPIMLDEANTTPQGQSVSINGHTAQVATKMSGTAQMNRDIAVMTDTDFSECIQGTVDRKYFGAIVSGQPRDIEGLASSEGITDDPSMISKAKFEDNNRSFWRANGTPILLQMMAYVGVLGAFATGSERRGALQRNIREIGILNAQGVSMKNIGKVESRRALIETSKATVIAAPLMPLMAGVFNMAEVGLKVGVGLREVAVGYTVTLAAKLAGSRRAVKKYSKKLNVSEAIRG